MLQLSTFVQQRSFGYTWLAAVGSHIQIPSGVITGLSVVTTDKNPVSVSNISVTKQDGLGIVLMQNNKQIASLSTKEENSTVAMKVEGPCLSAVVETGGFMAAPFSFVPSTAQYIRRNLVSVVDEVQRNKYYITVDDQKYYFDDNVEVAFDSQYLGADFGLNRHMKFWLTPEAKALFNPKSADVIIGDMNLLYAINGIVPGEDGSVTISMSVDGAKVELKKQGEGCIGIYSTVNPCEQDNRIDLAISPNRIGESGKKPLDAAYTQVDEMDSEAGTTIKRWVRDYVTNLEVDKTYGEDPAVGLFELEPLHDE